MAYNALPDEDEEFRKARINQYVTFQANFGKKNDYLFSITSRV